MKRCMALLIFLLFPSILNSAQDGTCHSPRFFPGTYARVIGSLDVGGLPYRSQPELAAEVEGFYAIGAVLETNDGEACVDGRVWYRVLPVDEEADNYGNWVMDGDENSYWLEPIGFCDNRQGTILREFHYEQSYHKIVDIDYDYENNRILLGVVTGDASRDQPALFDWYSMNPETGEFEAAEYPYADIVTRELTDFLGISDFVFGKQYANENMLLVSPDKSRILYFHLGERAESPCAHNCQLLNLYTANIDGSDPVYLGITSTEVGTIGEIVWGANNRIYRTSIPEVSPYYSTAEICLDGTCSRSLRDALLEYGVPDELADSGARASVSPNGRYLAVSLIYRPEQFVVDMQTGEIEMLPDKGDVSLPLIWSSNRSLFMGIDYESLSESNETLWFNHDAIIEQNLSFETGETGARGYTAVHERIFEFEFPTEWLISMNPPRAVVLGGSGGAGIYCLGLG